MKLQWRIATFKNGFQQAAAYRAEWFLEFFGFAFVAAGVQLVLWYAMFDLGGATKIAGMDYKDMVYYTLVSALFGQIQGGNLDFDLQEWIRTGHLSNYLLRPVGAVEFLYLQGLASKIVTTLLCLMAGIALGFFIDIHPFRIIGAMSLALLGNIIHYQISSVAAATAFLWEEASSVLMVKNMVIRFLSGELIPLTLFPQSSSWIWESTPFYLFVFGPTQYALGHWSHEDLVRHIGIAFAWILFGWVAVKVTWGLGIRRYLSLGG